MIFMCFHLGVWGNGCINYKSGVILGVKILFFVDRNLEKVKVKYQRSFFDWEQAQMDYAKADASNDVSRKDVSWVLELSKTVFKSFHFSFK